MASLLNVAPGRVAPALRDVLDVTESHLQAELERIAGSVVPVRSRNNHRELFLAFQFAALSLLAKRKNTVGRHAAIVLHQLFDFREVATRSLSLGIGLRHPPSSPLSGAGQLFAKNSGLVSHADRVLRDFPTQ